MYGPTGSYVRPDELSCNVLDAIIIHGAVLQWR